MSNNKINWKYIDQFRQYAHDTFGQDIPRDKALKAAVDSGMLDAHGNPTKSATEKGMFDPQQNIEVDVKRVNHINPNVDYNHLLQAVPIYYIQTAKANKSRMPKELYHAEIHDMTIAKQAMLRGPSTYGPNDWEYRLMFGYKLIYNLRGHVAESDIANVKHHFNQDCKQYTRYVGDQDKALDEICFLIKSVKQEGR